MVEMGDKKHPSQKQITTIKKYWSCHTIKDYCTKFKMIFVKIYMIN